MQTVSIRREDVTPKWYVVDAENKVLGRLACEVAKILRGKHKPFYTPHVDTGDYVVVVNADKVVLTGKKWAQKLYRWHTGYAGGFREVTAEKMPPAQAQAACRTGGSRHASEDQTGSRHVSQTESVHGGNAPACRPAAAGPGHSLTCGLAPATPGVALDSTRFWRRYGRTISLL